MIKKEINEIKSLFDTLQECGILKLAGCYVNGEKTRVVEFTENFLTLPEEERFKYLEIFRNYITDISPLANCENLVDLNLCNNTISDYSPLLELKHLRRLWLARSNNYGNVPLPSGTVPEPPYQPPPPAPP